MIPLHHEPLKNLVALRGKSLRPRSLRDRIRVPECSSSDHLQRHAMKQITRAAREHFQLSTCLCIQQLAAHLERMSNFLAQGWRKPGASTAQGKPVFAEGWLAHFPENNRFGRACHSAKRADQCLSRCLVWAALRACKDAFCCAHACVCLFWCFVSVFVFSFACLLSCLQGGCWMSHLVENARRGRLAKGMRSCQPASLKRTVVNPVDISELVFPGVAVAYCGKRSSRKLRGGFAKGMRRCLPTYQRVGRESLSIPTHIDMDIFTELCTGSLRALKI